MKIDSINSSLGLVNFKSHNEQVQSAHTESKSSGINKKKLLYATLGALAVAGAVAVIVNNARKGKIKPEMPDIIPAPKPEPPKSEPLKPVDIKVIQEKPEFSPEALDERILGTKNNDGWSFDDMKKYYEKLDAKGKKQVEAIVEQTRQNLHGSKPEFSPEALEQRTINGAVKQDAWSPEDMKAYYGNDCARVRKSTSYTSYKYVSEDDKPLFEKRVYNALSEYGEGAVEIRKTNKIGSVISEITSADGKLIKTQISNPETNYSVAKYFENGKLSKIVSNKKDGYTETLFFDGVKTSIHKNKDGSEVFKIYEQDNIGRYHCIRRETLKNEMGWKRGYYSCFDKYDVTGETRKTVEYINNGKYSKTRTTQLKYDGENDYKIVEDIIRDRKGNIIKDLKITKPRKPKGPDGANNGKLLASWYKDYLKLCEKYGVSPRPCGVKGGAGDHYFELCLRRSDKEAYERYLRLQEYRAKYDETAMLEQILRIGDEKSLPISPEKLEKLSPEQLKTLLTYINKGYIKVEDLKNLSPKNADELIAAAEKQEQVIKAAREAERRLEEQREAELMSRNLNQETEREIIVYA